MKGYVKSSITTTTAPSNLARMRGFTITLLFCLENNEMTLGDIVEITGKYSQYVQRYLYNMRNYGLLQKEGPYWKLTDIGSSFLEYLKSLDNIIYNIPLYKKEIRKKYERNKKEIRKLGPKSPRQISIKLWLANSDLNGAEKEVVEVLVDHYNRTGSKFILVRDRYELAERYNLNPQTLSDALKRLTQDNIIYVWHWRSQGVIGGTPRLKPFQ